LEPQNLMVPGWPFNEAEAKKRQADAGPKTELTFDLGGGVTMAFTLIPAGEFVMGDAAGCPDEMPLSRVKIGKPFYMGKFEVTATQYRLFDPTHDNGFFDQHHKDHTTPGYPADGPKKPVIRITWTEAMAFCKWLSVRTGRQCTLPTEAQWEWACRAGTATPLYYGDVDTDFSRYANLADLSIKLLAVDGINPQPIANPGPYQDFLPKEKRFNDGQKLMADVGQYQPNAWGLHDMCGNVWEWTRTSFGAYPYREDDGRNNLSLTEKKVVRGGSFYDRPFRATSAFRLAYRTYQPVWNVGFRVVCEAGGTNVAAR
jgi:formylglycine-generating enzyme required for sulfatase activity